MRLTVRRQVWPVRGQFTISRGSRTEAHTLVVEATDGPHVGRGECTPYARYGESLASVEGQIQSATAAIEARPDRALLARLLPAGAARNGIDCALWDLEAKRTGQRVWHLAGLPRPEPVTTAFTLSLDTPEAMGKAARATDRPVLKLKLTGDGDLERVAAVREAAPRATLIVDANEAWQERHLAAFVPELHRLGVALIEQPLPAGHDEALQGYDGPVPLAADESCHDLASLPALVGRYAYGNVKLDKTGGLTEALALKRALEEAGLQVMVGCMLASSLAMAPAHLVAQGAALVDLDGPLLLADDWRPGLVYEGARALPPEPACWG